MALQLVPQELDALIGTAEAVWLGIILLDGTVRLQQQDTGRTPGHTAWLENAGIEREHVRAGFSLIVEDGMVTGLLRYSVMNGTPDHGLDAQLLVDLTQLLPLAVGFRVYGR